jgi:hypothetical protein
MGLEVEAAKRAVGARCGQDEAETLRLVADALTSAGLCAAGPWGKAEGHGDAVAVKAPDGLVEEWHVVAFTNGCWTGDPYRNAWPSKRGPPPSTPCGDPAPPPFGRWNQRCPAPHGQWFHCTPLVGPDDAYCALIGYTDGRTYCPVRHEGHPERTECERLVVGGDPLWRSDGRTVVKPDNPYMARCSGCSVLEVCLADGTGCQRGAARR